MSDEREHVTFFDLVRWSIPTALVLAGVVLYFLYSAAASAIGAAVPTP